jgi:uncharacterized protein (DUF302 family)
MQITQSKHTCSSTLDKLSALLAEKGIQVFTTIDHSAAAVEQDMDLDFTTVVIFGDPKVGTLLMQADRRLAVELPLKILIWQQDGSCQVGYNKLQDIVEKNNYDLGDKQNIVAKIDDLMATLVSNICE